MADKMMEVSIGDYGRMIFEIVHGEKFNQMPEHWQAIAKEAKPLIDQLLALNDKMPNGGYRIVGRKVKGKKQKSKRERILEAQKRLWEVEASTLKEGDLVWLHANYDHEMHVGQEEPVLVEDITAKGVYVEMPHCGGRHTERIDPTEKVLKAPDAFKAGDAAAVRWHKGEISDETFNELRAAAERQEQELQSEEFWLQKAAELGI